MMHQSTVTSRTASNCYSVGLRFCLVVLPLFDVPPPLLGSCFERDVEVVVVAGWGEGWGEGEDD